MIITPGYGNKTGRASLPARTASQVLLARPRAQVPPVRIDAPPPVGVPGPGGIFENFGAVQHSGDQAGARDLLK